MAANRNNAAAANVPQNAQYQQQPPAVNPPQQRNAVSRSDEPEERNLSQCCICLQYMPAEEGLSCLHGHFICDDCLGNYFESRVNIENIQTHLLRIPCPVPDCQADSFASLRVIATHLLPISVGRILDNLQQVLEVFNQRQPVIVEPGPEPPPQDDIGIRRRHVIDNILTLKRPCCGLAFFDFAGCCAVTCPNCPPARNAFCAVCLAPCGNDAHAHVRNVHGNLFITDEQWQTQHNLRRQAILLEYLRRPGEDWNRDEFLDAIHGDLAGVGMDTEEIRRRYREVPDMEPVGRDGELVEELLQEVDRLNQRVDRLNRMREDEQAAIEEREDNLGEREDDIINRELALREERRLFQNEQQLVAAEQIRQREDHRREERRHLLQNEQHRVAAEELRQREDSLREKEVDVALNETNVGLRETNVALREANASRREIAIYEDQRGSVGQRKVTNIVWIVLILIICALSTAFGLVVSQKRGDTSVISIDSNTTTTAITTSTSTFASAVTATTTAVASATSASLIPSLTHFGPLSRDNLMELPSPLPQPINSYRGWGTEQLLGVPNTFTYGDADTAWEPQTKDGSYEWILLDYETLVYPARIDVYESYNPGAVVAIWVFPPGSNATAVNGAELFWSGPPQTNLTPALGAFTYYTNNSDILGTEFVTSRILVILDISVPGWNAIDAVGLVDASIFVQWALGAAASSCYAGGNYFSISQSSGGSGGGGGMPWWQILLIVLATLFFGYVFVCICVAINP